MSADVVVTNLPRGRWLLRMAALSVLLLLAMLIARSVASARANARLAELETRLRAAGIPTRLEDIATTQPVSPADDAAPLWTNAFDAAAAAATESPRASRYGSDELGEWPPYNALWHRLVDASESANAGAFALAERAAAKPACAWPVDPRDPTTLAGGLNRPRYLANLLDDSAERAFIAGDTHMGIARVRTSLALARHLRVRRTLFPALVAAGIDAMTTKSVRMNVASLKIGDTPGAASPDEVRGLIARLLDTADARRDVAGALRAEVAFAKFDDERIYNGGWLSRPVSVMRRTRTMEELGDFLLHVAPDQPGARARARRETQNASPGELRASRLFEVGLRPDMRLFNIFEATFAARHAAAIALATRWYQLDHNGQFPTSLDQLVPTYLPEVPPNPLSLTGQPYGYRLLPHALPDGSDRPLLVIDFGDAEPDAPPAEPEYEVLVSSGYGLNRRNQGHWSDLTSWTPRPAPPAPATQPDDEEP